MTRVCRLCFQRRRGLRNGVVCEDCVQAGPREIAKHHGRRVRQLRRHAQRLAQDVRGIELVAAELERIAGWLKTIDRRTWRKTKDFSRLIELASIDMLTEIKQ